MPEFDTIDTDDVVCPSCGTCWCYDQPAFDPGDYSESKKGVHTCEECEMDFKFFVTKTVSCSTFKMSEGE